VTGADDGGSGMVDGPSVPPEGPGLGRNMGNDGLLLIVLLCPSRRVRNPLRNVWFFRMW